MLRTFITSCTIVAVALAGCSAGTKERVLMRYESSKRPQMRDAPYDGEYRVYASRNPIGQQLAPLLTERMKRGERLGFSRDDSGQVIFIVRGAETAPAASTPTAPAAGESAQYSWTVQPDAGQIDRGKTIALVVVVAVVVALGVGFAVAGVSSSGGSVVSSTAFFF